MFTAALVGDVAPLPSMELMVVSVLSDNLCMRLHSALLLHINECRVGVCVCVCVWSAVVSCWIASKYK